MRLLFFDQAGKILFERSDDESASVVHEEMSFQALYPYDSVKVIQRGMRVGYQDDTGVWQLFEIRKAKDYEPDHYQEITAEHICISELTDEHFEGTEFTDVTAAAALTQLLTGTGWSVGTDTSAGGTSSGNVSMGPVWQSIRTIENNWNVYILPRVTVGPNGITGKYLDIVPPGGTWRGLRLSLDKNADEMGVTWDDSNVKTALYAYGKTVKGEGDEPDAPLTFTDTVWAATADHPAKPAGQAYLEDPQATAAFGRNGRPRFGYYQNGDISDPQILLEKTWESLKAINHPDVTVSGLVCDLHRLGLGDVPIRLHDIAMAEIRQTGITLELEIVQYTEDLNDPMQSRLTIGTYIPNIIYINRETNKAAGGGGGRGQTDSEYKETLFRTELLYSQEQLTIVSEELTEVDSSVAEQAAQLTVTRRGVTSLATGTGAMLNPDGTLVLDAYGNPVFTTDGSGLYSKIEQNATAINLRVVKGQVATQLTVECGNVHVTGTAGNANLVVDGYVEADTIFSASATHQDIYANNLTVDDTLNFENLVGSGTSSIEAASIEAMSLTLNGDPILGVIVDATVSGNVLTLTKDDGTTVNFSKATTLTGGWRGGTYEVIAEQNGDTVGTITETPILYLNGNGTDSFSAELHDGINSPTVRNSVYGYLGVDTTGTTPYVRVYKDSARTQAIAAIAVTGVAPTSIVRTGYNLGDHTVTVEAQNNGTPIISQTISAVEIWNDGWDDAYDMVDPPATAASGEVTSFTYKVPSSTRGSQHTSTFNLTKGTPSSSGGYASVTLNGYAVGRISLNNWWTAGWNDGYDTAFDCVSWPKVTSTTRDRFSFSAPKSRSAGGGPSVGTYILSADNNYCYVKGSASGNAYMRINNPAWNNAAAATAIPPTVSANTTNFDITIPISGGTTVTYNYTLSADDDYCYVRATASGNLKLRIPSPAANVTIVSDDSSITATDLTDSSMIKFLSSSHASNNYGQLNIKMGVTLSNGKRFTRTVTGVATGATYYDSRSYTLYVRSNTTGTYTQLSQKQLYYYGSSR